MISACIFDMDDLLVRSAATWKAAEAHLLRMLGHDWDPVLARQYKGMNALDVAATIHRALRPMLSLAECQMILRRHLIESFSAGNIEPMPGAMQLVKRLHGRKRLAVASGSPLVAIEGAMTQLGCRHYFELLISSESVPRGKPAPDVFLAAAAELRLGPDQCHVLEDSLIGVGAAVAAGMRCFAVPSTPNQDDIRAAGATRIFNSLADIDPSMIDEL
jgi:HAD superfamily hydrolase (TIGR01509 family)